MSSPTDYLQQRVEANLEKVQLAAISEESNMDDASLADEVPDEDLFDKIRFKWRPEDQAILSQIRVLATEEREEIFADVIEIIDTLYGQLRVPEESADGTVRRGADGRPVWKRNEYGYIERIDQLTGQDLEKAILDLQRVVFIVAPRVNELMLEAVYARDTARDFHDDAWHRVLDGTVGDRTAAANRSSRQDRYHAFFRFYLYSSAQTFLKEVTQFSEKLEKLRYRQVTSQPR